MRSMPLLGYANKTALGLPLQNDLDSLPRVGGFIRGHHDLHVFQPFFAGRERNLVLRDAGTKGIHLRREMIDRRVRNFLALAAVRKIKMIVAVRLEWRRLKLPARAVNLKPIAAKSVSGKNRRDNA